MSMLYVPYHTFERICMIGSVGGPGAREQTRRPFPALLDEGRRQPDHLQQWDAGHNLHTLRHARPDLENGRPLELSVPLSL